MLNGRRPCASLWGPDGQFYKWRSESGHGSYRSLAQPEANQDSFYTQRDVLPSSNTLSRPSVPLKLACESSCSSVLDSREQSAASQCHSLLPRKSGHQLAARLDSVNVSADAAAESPTSRPSLLATLATGGCF